MERLLLALAASMLLASSAHSAEPWQTLPKPPPMPQARKSGMAPVNGILMYALMADDYLALLDFLKIRKVALVGWSDGGIIGLDIAIRHPERLSRLLAFGANYRPEGAKDVANDPVFNAYIVRAREEYAALSPTPGEFDAFLKQISQMWVSEPRYSEAQLRSIAVPTLILDGQYDEAISPSTHVRWQS
jgi:pimeloyl-ACP methyl ester carboxylesterase